MHEPDWIYEGVRGGRSHIAFSPRYLVQLSYFDISIARTLHFRRDHLTPGCLLSSKISVSLQVSRYQLFSICDAKALCLGSFWRGSGLPNVYFYFYSNLLNSLNFYRSYLSFSISTY